MFSTLAGALLVYGATDPTPHPVGPVSEVVRISDVDLAKGRFTIVRTHLEYASRVLEMEVVRDGKTVKVLRKVGVEESREITEEYAIKHWRVTDKRGTEFDWARAKGKTVLLHRDNQPPARTVLQLLSKDALILFGRD